MGPDDQDHFYSFLAAVDISTFTAEYKSTVDQTFFRYITEQIDDPDEGFAIQPSMLVYKDHPFIVSAPLIPATNSLAYLIKANTIPKGTLAELLENATGWTNFDMVLSEYAGWANNNGLKYAYLRFNNTSTTEEQFLDYMDQIGTLYNKDLEQDY